MIRNVPSPTTAAVLASERFDWAVAALSAWLIGGIHLDVWAHHRIEEALETFFTPWHSVLYSGFLALASLLVVLPIPNLGRGRTWRCRLTSDGICCRRPC